MVANFRCNEMREEAMDLVKKQLEQLKSQSDRQIIEQFGEDCNSIMQQAVHYFEDSAKQYNQEVFSKILSELKE